LGLQGGVVDNMDFSPDGARLAAVAQHVERKGKDRYSVVHLVSAWEVETGKRVGPALQPKEYVAGMRFHPDGKRLVFANQTKVTVRNVETGRELAGEYTGPLEDKLAPEAADISVKDGQPRKSSLGRGNAYLTLVKATTPEVGWGAGGE